MKLEPGQNYLVFTVTHYWLGRLVSQDGPYSVTLTDACWVSETGRLHRFLADGKADGMEVEPLPDGLPIMVQHVAVCPWPHPLLRSPA